LLRSCRAPCSGEEVMDALFASGIDYTLLFYEPEY
jgi:predicted adenine nucleotide alpha hydrolase (AANH) superfamily ATPase